MTTNRKGHLKVYSHYFKLPDLQFHLICQIFKKFSFRPYLSLSKSRKRKRQFLYVLTYSIKRALQSRKFHIVVVQRRQIRNSATVVTWRHTSPLYWGTQLNLSFVFQEFQLTYPTSRGPSIFHLISRIHENSISEKKKANLQEIIWRAVLRLRNRKIIIIEVQISIIKNQLH